MRRAGIILGIIGAITGCASGVQIPREVLVPTPIACIAPADKPARPSLMSDGEILALDSYRATWALWGERLTLTDYTALLEAVVEGCSRIPAPNQ